MNDQFVELMLQSPIPADGLRRVITDNAKAGAKAEDLEDCITRVQDALIEAGDFEGLLGFLSGLARDLPLDAAFGASARLLLKKIARDKPTLAALDCAGFDEQPPIEAFRRFEFLRSLKTGMIVMDKSWGVGVVKVVDVFFKRVNVDFHARKNHPVPMAQAAALLSPVGAEHLLAQKLNNPAALAQRAKEAPADVIREALRDFGPMSVTRLEETLATHQIANAAEWKNMWEAARKILKADPRVDIPVKRADPITYREQAADFASAWLKAFYAERDIPRILGRIDEARQQDAALLKRGDFLDALADRMAFAEKGTFRVDAALYARLALECRRLELAAPAPEIFRAHLWDASRYVDAAAGLTARDTEDLVEFLFADEKAPARVVADIGRLPYALLENALAKMRGTPAAPDAAARCMEFFLLPKAPPAFVLWALRNRGDFKDWKLPNLHDLMTHGLALLDEKFMKEELRLQNNIKALFENPRWFEPAFAELDPLQRQSVFERIQSADAWRNEPNALRQLISRMVKAEPGLANLRKTKSGGDAKAAARLTSWRSLAERQKAYRQLVEIDIPKNVQDIATARSFGDLRENFEYQAAKDRERQLHHRQFTMEKELSLVKGGDFANTPLDRVGPGVRVTLALPDGVEKTYTILGEWDSDEALNIISCRSRLAQCLEGRAAGDSAMIPAEGGTEQPVTVQTIAPLDAETMAWIGISV